jgi:hypothetical protein
VTHLATRRRGLEYITQAMHYSESDGEL